MVRWRKGKKKGINLITFVQAKTNEHTPCKTRTKIHGFYVSSAADMALTVNIQSWTLKPKAHLCTICTIRTHARAFDGKIQFVSAWNLTLRKDRTLVSLSLVIIPESNASSFNIFLICSIIFFYYPLDFKCKCIIAADKEGSASFNKTRHIFICH